MYFSPCRVMEQFFVLQVRAAATLGGNLVLTRDRGLESDAVTLLMAAGAEVQTASPGSKPAWQSVRSFVGASSDPTPGEVVIAVRLPAVKPGDRFWSFKVCPYAKRKTSHGAALMHNMTMLLEEGSMDDGLDVMSQIAERHWNAHAFINIAVLVQSGASKGEDLSSAIKTANVVFGYPSQHEGGQCALAQQLSMMRLASTGIKPMFCVHEPWNRSNPTLLAPIHTPS